MKFYIFIIILISTILLILGFLDLNQEKKSIRKEALQLDIDKEALQVIKGKTYEKKEKREEEKEESQLEIFDENDLDLLTEQEINIIYNEEENNN